MYRFLDDNYESDPNQLLRLKEENDEAMRHLDDVPTRVFRRPVARIEDWGEQGTDTQPSVLGLAPTTQASADFETEETTIKDLPDDDPYATLYQEEGGEG